MTSVPAPGLSSYDRYEVAYLVGGHHRLVDTAVAALLEAGRITARPTGQLHAVGLWRGHPVEAAVLDALGTRGRSLAPLRWRLTEDQRVRSVADPLVHDGLLTPPGARRLFRRATDGRRTAAGRRVVRRLRAERPEGFDVALWGPSRMADPAVRDAVFHVAHPPHTGRPFRGHVADDLGSFPGPYWVPVQGGAGADGRRGGGGGG